MKFFLFFISLNLFIILNCLSQIDKIQGVYNFENNINDTVLYLDQSGYFSIHHDLKFAGLFPSDKNVFVEGSWVKKGKYIYITSFIQPSNWDVIKIKKYEKKSNKNILSVKVNLIIDSLSKTLMPQIFIYLKDSEGKEYKMSKDLSSFEFNISNNIKWIQIFGHHYVGPLPRIYVTNNVTLIELDVKFSLQDNPYYFPYSHFYFEEKFELKKSNEIQYRSYRLKKVMPF